MVAVRALLRAVPTSFPLSGRHSCYRNVIPAQAGIQRSSRDVNSLVIVLRQREIGIEAMQPR
jgi:hypothetical protein